MKQEWEFNGVVRLTKVGTTYILATMILAISAINTGNNAIYIAVTLMLGCLLLSGIASKGGLKHLSVEIQGIDEAWAGRPADGSVRIRNDSRIWNVRDVVLVSEALVEYLMLIVQTTRAHAEVALGVSTRGALTYFKACQALAMVCGRDFVIPEDVKRLAVPVLSHRIVIKDRRVSRGDFSPEARFIQKLVHEIAVPR